MFQVFDFSVSQIYTLLSIENDTNNDTNNSIRIKKTFVRQLGYLLNNIYRHARNVFVFHVMDLWLLF